MKKIWEKGDRVKLKHNSNYLARKDNPKVGSKFECGGTIDPVYSSSIGVQWDNGTHNSYANRDLVSAGPYIDLWFEV